VDRIPAWIKMAVQAPGEIPFNGVYYDPPPEQQHQAGGLLRTGTPPTLNLLIIRIFSASV
jgi:hypothetical protein